MSDFLTKTSCRGRRPLHIVQRRYCSRPELVTKLLRERNVARFIVAPDGFGKSSVAFEYAETVFHFDHVFWIDAKSPCFLRDLDNACIAQTLLSEDAASFLVVVEDVPLLDSKRVEALLKEIDCILERNCEVLVTCTPSCDAFHHHHDRVKLTPFDFLLSDDEIDALRTGAERQSQPASLMPTSQRIAALVWGTPSERASFLARLMNEEFPEDLRLLLLVIFLLQKGSVDDLVAFTSCGTDSIDLLARRYPYAGIDKHQERFVAADFSVDEIAVVFSSHLNFLGAHSAFTDGDGLVVRIANVLVRKQSYRRACDTVRLMAGRKVRAAWLVQQSLTLADGVCLLPACEVYKSLGREKTEERDVVEVGEACRQALLKDYSAACLKAQKVIDDLRASRPAKAAAALIVACCAKGTKRMESARVAVALTDMLLHDANEGKDEVNGAYCSLAVGAAVRLALEVSCVQAAQTWLSWYERGARGRVVMQSGTWILERAMSSKKDFQGTDKSAGVFYRRVACILHEQLLRCQDTSVGLFDALAGISLERACEQQLIPMLVLDPCLLVAIHQIELSLFTQRGAHERDEQKQEIHKDVYRRTHPDMARIEPTSRVLLTSFEPEPLLTVNLFGGLDVYIGDKHVDAALFRRQKVKVLLALLVLNRGREFSRDKLVGLLWPESNLEAARKNFYGIWSTLRRALTTPAGTCPYLIRQQRGLRIDASLLISDVAQLDDICNILLFEHADYGGWAQILSQIEEKFSDDILPSENENDAIVGRRLECRDKLVDALLAAASRLVGAGDAQLGLWFARDALAHDRTREDVYITLMKAQLAAGQRTAALETYFSCRRFLVEELGIDPSIETMRLYNSIIESEEVIG